MTGRKKKREKYLLEEKWLSKESWKDNAYLEFFKTWLDSFKMRALFTEKDHSPPS
jgi:hypothetical protein